MEELRRNASNPIWHDGEQTKLVYGYPIARDPSLAGHPGVHDWRSVAEGHIVVTPGYATPSNKRYGLLEGIPDSELYELGGFPCAKSPESHLGQFLNAIDFLVPDGTPVLAVQDGTVIAATDHHVHWGDSPTYSHCLNYIDIQHESGEIAEYCHLAQYSTKTWLGGKVKKGQVIATVGKTGWTDRDHLHLLVYRLDNGNPANPLNEGGKFKSMKIRFDD